MFFKNFVENFDCQNAFSGVKFFAFFSFFLLLCIDTNIKNSVLFYYLKERTMKKFSFLFLALVLVVSMAFITISCQRQGASASGASDGPVPIGTVAPISGSLSFYGIEVRDGALMALEEINAAGGLLGRQLRLVVEDDEGDAAKANSALTKLINVDKVSLVVGSVTSGATMGMTQLAQSQKVVVMAPSATNINVTNAGDYIFRACIIDPFQGVVGADFAYGTMGSRRAAVLYDAGADYNTGLAEEFSKRFVANGGQIVANEAYQSGDVDFNAQVTRIRAANPDIIFLPNYYYDLALQARQLRAQGITAPFLGGDGWDGLIDHVQEEVLNSYWTALFAADTTDPKGAAFVRAFQARFNRVPSSFAALGYDSLVLIADGVKAANSFDSTAVKDAIARTNGVYATGNIRYDSNRNPIKSLAVLEIVRRPDGTYANVFKTSVNP